ncbi:transketolase-like TK C-terminal-containing protein [Cupriavidus basilensis]
MRLVGSGAILREVIAAADLLSQDWNIEAEIWSATSFSELAREAREVERWNRLNPQEEPRQSHVACALSGESPVIVATDYVRAWPQLVAPYVDARLTVLGTDGFRRSDTRSALRSFFEVDRHHVVLAALESTCPKRWHQPHSLQGSDRALQHSRGCKSSMGVLKARISILRDTFYSR